MFFFWKILGKYSDTHMQSHFSQISATFFPFFVTLRPYTTSHFSLSFSPFWQPYCSYIPSSIFSFLHFSSRSLSTLFPLLPSPSSPLHLFPLLHSSFLLYFPFLLPFYRSYFLSPNISFPAFFFSCFSQISSLSSCSLPWPSYLYTMAKKEGLCFSRHTS